MKHFILLACFSLLVIPLSGQSGPDYSDPETKSLITKMITAHGGMTTWQNAPTLSYHHVMIDPRNRADEWISDEVHEQGSRRNYHDWPADKARLGFDGENVWSLDWKRLNPPAMMAAVSYYFINIPWITQDNGVVLEQLEDTEVPYIEKGKSFYTVKMTYAGGNPYEYYELYIDKDSYLLKGLKYTMVDKDLMKVFKLPADTKFMGPVVKVYKEYTSVEGLKMPARYDTYVPQGDGVLMGEHLVSNYSLRKPFDESKVVKPEKGVIFHSLNN